MSAMRHRFELVRLKPDSPYVCERLGRRIVLVLVACAGSILSATPDAPGSSGTGLQRAKAGNCAGHAASISAAEPELLSARNVTPGVTFHGSQVSAAGRGRQAGDSQDLFDEIYARGAPVQRSLRTVRARFTETTTSSLLVDPLVSEGRLVVVRPADVLIDYVTPEPRSIRTDGRELWLLWPGRGLRERQDVHAAVERVQKYFVDKTPDELRRHFRIDASDDPDRSGSWRVTMLPIRAGIKKGLTRLDVWIAQDTMLPASLRITSPNGDTRTWVFRDMVVNQPVSPAELQLR